MKLLLENWRKFLKEGMSGESGWEDDPAGPVDSRGAPFDPEWGEEGVDWDYSYEDEFPVSSTDSADWEEDEPGYDESIVATGEVGPRTQKPIDYATSTRTAGMGPEGEDLYQSIPSEEASAELYSASYDLDPSGAGEHGAGARAYIRRILDDKTLKINTPEAAEEYYKDHIRDQLRPSAVEHVTHTPEGSAFGAGKPLPAEAYYDQGTGKVYIDPANLAATGNPYDDTLHHEQAHGRDLGVNLYAGLPPEDQVTAHRRRGASIPIGTDLEDMKQGNPERYAMTARMSRVQYEEMKELFPGMAHDPDARPGMVDLRPKDKGPLTPDEQRAAHGSEGHEIHAGLSYQRALINKAYQDGLRDSPDFTEEDVKIFKKAGTDYKSKPGESGLLGGRIPYAHQASDLYYALGNIANTKLSDQEIADRLNRIAMAPTGQQQPAQLVPARQQQPSLPGQDGRIAAAESMEKRTFDKWRKFLKEEKSRE